VARVALRMTRRCSVVALLLYAYARGNRSSRQIERACWEDVAYKVICSMRVPDHSTIAEFRRRHEAAIAELFDQVLGLCREAGLVSVGVIMVDGTKIKANASMDQNRSYSGVVREILREAEETDRREDELYGDARGDELPEQLRTAEGRKQALADAKRRIEERKGRPVGPQEPAGDVEVDPELVLGRGGRRGGRREWPRVARRELESRREREAEPIPRDREDRLFQALGRLEENHRVDLAANDAYQRWRSSSRDTLGRVMKGYSGDPVAVVGDAGYWHTEQIEAITDRGIEVLVPPDGAAREGKRPGWENERYEHMREKLATERGRALYALRKTTIEPVFGQIKYNRRVTQFMRRGRAAVHSELRLVAATHNLLKLHNHWIANTA